MQPCPAPPPLPMRTRPRTALLASADDSFRQRLNEVLTGLRWHVSEAQGGADAWTQARNELPEAVIVDSWLPDLDCGEFVRDFCSSFPEVALLSRDGSFPERSWKGPHRQELLFALQKSSQNDGAIWNSAYRSSEHPPVEQQSVDLEATSSVANEQGVGRCPDTRTIGERGDFMLDACEKQHLDKNRPTSSDRLPEFVGQAACMLEVSRRIRLVAGRSTPVLIEGPTGSGKELVAEALHRLSSRSRRALVAINCAAIPEALLEAELFGHTRGAFTGAVQGRVGRIEAADGGTLFLDEIGEMPLALQAKLLRFVESGELQRVGDNETVKVDVRIVAATHRPLAEHTTTGAFRADLYYRLAVFLIRTPSLADHMQDVPQLVQHFLEKMGQDEPMKRIDRDAGAKLLAHGWPGNVRELEHVLERAAILAGDAPMITVDEIDFGETTN
ncbi:MAG TPA: sigma-54 dependent transcriptional regulator [Terracidiphilus sp.]|nr:sigma-54 dependent transcriptional regulator [Terracidiphilus sp.]